MTVRVRASDGSFVEFPDDVSDDEIATAMRQMDQELDARRRAQPPPPTPRPQPSPAQRGEATSRALRRDQIRNSIPFGLGFITQPFVNTILDPDRRAAAGRSFQGFLRDVQQIPSLDLGRLANDTGNTISQGVQHLPQTVGNVLTHPVEVVDAMSTRPFREEESQQRALDLARIMGDQRGVETAANSANARTAEAGLNVAGPLAFGGSGSALRGAAVAAALDAPFALSRGEGDLQERLPNAIAEIGGSAAFGGATQAAANAIPRIARALPSRGADMVRRMDQAGATVDAQGQPQQPRGVTPSFATANGGSGVSAPATNIVADNIFAGAPTRGRVRQSATELRDAVHDVRDTYGAARNREGAGQIIERGVDRYANDRNIPNPNPGQSALHTPTRDWSFASKARAVFDEVLRPIEGNTAQLARTRQVLNDLQTRADAPQVRAFNADPVLQRLQATVKGLETRAQRGTPPTLRDLRELRRGVREAQGRVRIGPDSVDNAALQRMEAALTEDIYAAAGPAAANLRRADQFYARGMRRIQGTLSAMDGIPGILRAASPRTLNTRALATLRSALRDDEWRIVAASLIDDMGQPLPGAKGFVAEQGFSIERFATAYRNMHPRARQILFGSRAGQGGQSGRTMRTLANDLDNLAVIADAQKAVSAGANSSGSATHLQNIGSIVSLVNPATAVPTMMGIIGGLLTGEILTNPAFVRWLVSAQRRAGGRAGMRQNLATLRDLATRDPALLPVVARLEAELQGQQSQPAPDASGDPASSTRETVGASR